jgi:hypothetical protein
MENDTNYPSLTLFSVRADYMGCEYGSLFIVAAEIANDAADIVRARLDRGATDMAVTIESCDPIGTTTPFDGPMVVEQFAT